MGETFRHAERQGSRDGSAQWRLRHTSKDRAYDWSHAIGRASANGTGFNYPQTMCLGNDGDVYVANRGNENNFGMRVNHIKVGGPGEEELLAEFATYGEKDENCVWPFGVAVDKNGDVYVTDEWKSTVSVFDAKGKFIRKWGTPGSGPGELKGPAGIVCEANGNLIVVDSGNNRLQVFTPEGKLVAQCGKAGSGDGEFNKPWGITLDKDGNIYVADWKNHRVQKLSPKGKFLMSIGKYGKVPVAPNAFAVTYLGPFISSVPDAERAAGGHPQSPHGCRGRSRRRHLCYRLGQSPALHFRQGRQAADPFGGRRPGDVEVGPAEHRRQPRHDEGVQAGAESGAALALLLPDGGGFQSEDRSDHRRRQSTQPPAGLQEGA